MNKPIDVRFWENEIEMILAVLRQAILTDIDLLMRNADRPETEDFCSLLSVIDDRRNVYAKLSEKLTQHCDEMRE